MHWGEDGSAALASLTAAFVNRAQNLWFSKHKVSFEMYSTEPTKTLLFIKKECGLMLYSWDHLNKIGPIKITDFLYRSYISCVDQYAKVEELPSGRGMADVVFLPKRRSVLPAMIVELKGNLAAEGAIQKINDRKYPKVLENYDGKIVLVGVSYDEKNKKHECRIEKHKK